MAGKIQAIRGMNDILADLTPRWQHLEHTVCRVLESYGYREIRVPVLEKTDLFVHSIGAATDIVSKEMYTFEDRNGDSLTLRPEGTAGCVRAGLQHSLFNNAVHRLWYLGPMFRRERPQKGRLRQFHQIGVEVFGLPGPDIDAEIIIMGARIWHALGLGDVSLQINSLGTPASRQRYRAELVEYLEAHREHLDADSRERLTRNPLRILDSKNPHMQPIIAAAPDMSAYLDREGAAHFQQLQSLLDAAGIPYTINPRLVRGLDYYSKTVFEWVTDRLGAQGTVCAGGRYDGMVEHFGGRPTPGIGFAMGLERILELIPDTGYDAKTPHIYLIVDPERAMAAGLTLAERIRDFAPQLRVQLHCGGGSFKSQFRKADRSGAELALVLGAEELERRAVTVKSLRLPDAPQIEVPWTGLPALLAERLGG